MRSWFKPTLLFAAVALSACGDSTGPDAQASIVGTWDIQSIDGNTLPWTLTETTGGVTCNFTLSTASITFNSNRTYNATQTFSAACAGQQPFGGTETFNGTYSVDGNQLTMTDTAEPNDPDVGTFTISGSTLTIVSVDDGETTTIVARRR